MTARHGNPGGGGTALESVSGLRFHWMLPQGGEVAASNGPQSAARYRIEATRRGSPAGTPDLEGWTEFAESAEEAGIESVLISFSRCEPDPLIVAAGLGARVHRLKFIVAYRSGLMLPSVFVQQLNTVSALIGGRLAVNLVAGSTVHEQHGYGDFLDHDQRYERAAEFLAVCRAFWRAGEKGKVDFRGRHYRVEGGELHSRFVAPDRPMPEIYVSGHSRSAERLAYDQGSCWLRVAESPGKIEPLVARSLERGVEVCLRACVLCRPTREEALAVLRSLLLDRDSGSRLRSTEIKDDSVMHREAPRVDDEAGWLDRTLWTGLVPYTSPVWTTLVGTPDELARAFLDYRRIGVSQFILSSWPERDEVVRFGREVIPRVRAGEQTAGEQTEVEATLWTPVGRSRRKGT